MNIDLEGEAEAAAQVVHQIVGDGEMIDDIVHHGDEVILEDEKLGTVDEVLLPNAQETVTIQGSGGDR